MNIEEIENLLMMGSIQVQRIEHKFSDNQMIITYREPSNQMLLCDPPRRVPDSFYKVVYGVEGGDLCAINIQCGHEKVTPEAREIVYT